jgi:hypothetical protein
MKYLPIVVLVVFILGGCGKKADECIKGRKQGSGTDKFKGLLLQDEKVFYGKRYVPNSSELTEIALVVHKLPPEPKYVGATQVRIGDEIWFFEHHFVNRRGPTYKPKPDRGYALVRQRKPIDGMSFNYFIR